MIEFIKRACLIILLKLYNKKKMQMGTPFMCLLITTLVASVESKSSQPSEGFMSNTDEPGSFTDGLTQMIWGNELSDNNSGQTGKSLDQIFDLKTYHDSKIDGRGIKIAVFDSGIGKEYQSEEMREDMNIVEIIDFTLGDDKSPLFPSDDVPKEEPLDFFKAVDANGHGTFVAGVISSTNERCPGIAPGAEVYILKLFTDDEITYSSWFLDAFNFVLDNDIDIVNLSTASKDSLDTPFRDKIAELTTAGVIVISAIGNDGPTQGSAENPGDITNVIGVGSLSSSLDDVAYFSSRGMTKANLLDGIGIFNPDVLMPGEEIYGLSLTRGKCDLKQGTSFSVPMLSASVALTLSAIDQKHGKKYRKTIQNTALIRQAIIKSSSRLKSRSIVEQGSGRFSLDAFNNQMLNLESLPEIQVYPYTMNLTNGSDYFLPFSRQRVYSSMMPMGMKFTLTNRESAHFLVNKERLTIRVENQEINDNNCLEVHVDFNKGAKSDDSNVMSPFFGQIQVDLIAPDTPECREIEASQLEILVQFPVTNYDAYGFHEKGHLRGEILTQFKIIVDFIKTPDRSRRLLYDQFHSLNYPTNGFIWSDDLDNQSEEDPYEWLGDHLFTNMQGLHQRLSKQGFYLEMLNQPMTCFDANNYKALLLVDPEDYLSQLEIQKLQIDIESKDLSLIVAADWYNEDKIEKKKYYNVVTFEEWQPFMGGSNVPAINELLEPYHIALGQGVYAGTFYLEGKPVDIVSGSEIIEFPMGGYLISPELNVQEPAPVREGDDDAMERFGKRNVPTIGIIDGLPNQPNSGSIIVMTDSDCVSGSRHVRSCLHLFEHFVGIATQPKQQASLVQQDHRANSTTTEDAVLAAAGKYPLDSQGQILPASAESAPWSVLLKENYRLPLDYHKGVEVRPIRGNFQKDVLDQEGTTHLIKGSYLNSMQAWDREKKQMTCKAPQISRGQIDTDLWRHDNYAHEHSEENIASWTQSPTSYKVIGGNMEWQSFFPAIGLLTGARMSGMWKLVLSFVAVFSIGIYLIKRFCLRQQKRSNAAQVRAARRAIHQTIAYESSNSDGFSGHSDYEIDSSSDSASTGDLAISFEENDLNSSSVTADYH